MPTQSITSPTTSHLSDLQRLASIMCIAIIIGAVIAEITLVWVWLFPEYVVEYVTPYLGLYGWPVSLDFSSRLIGFLLCMIPLAVIYYAGYQAFVLFDAFRRGEVFTSNAPILLRRVGFCMFALAILHPIIHALLSLALTISNPEGQRILSISVNLNDYMFALFGGLILAIAHVMVEAARIADENQQIV
jgi:Protein of unknown function (DUF2975)